MNTEFVRFLRVPTPVTYFAADPPSIVSTTTTKLVEAP
jgi:hypothetical protein